MYAFPRRKLDVPFHLYEPDRAYPVLFPGKVWSAKTGTNFASQSWCYSFFESTLTACHDRRTGILFLTWPGSSGYFIRIKIKLFSRRFTLLDWEEKNRGFSSRSPHRPNAIGMTVVQILSIEADRILISGLDMVEGTPVLDIKPYIPQWDSYPEASLDG
ncbi:MAG: SAM-dependent methyltransferase [Bdellovibrionales bacterium]|nr:SAM-dependent methyltransferase [Bdellovibrionales bacterium]